LKITHIITGLNDGGAEAVLYRLCSYDKVNQHRVVSLMDGGKYGPLLQVAGIQVECLSMPRGRFTLGGLLYLYRSLKKYPPDVVQTWMYHADLIGGILARLAGIRTVFWGIRHSNLTSGKVKKSTILVAWLCAKLSYWVPCAIVSCSKQAACVHQRLGYNKILFNHIPNGYDFDDVSPDAEGRSLLRAEWGVGPERCLLGMVARFDPQKDHANLLGALQLLKNSERPFLCVLVGEGMDYDNSELSLLIEEAGIRDKLLMLGRRSDIPRIMNALDIHVLSSVGEAFPNVLAEAMGCGTPCVTTDVGDAAMIVGDTGWIVPPSDSSLLATSILRAIVAMEDPEKWGMRKQKCRERVVANFCLEKMVVSYNEVWQSFSAAE